MNEENAYLNSICRRGAYNIVQPSIIKGFCFPYLPKTRCTPLARIFLKGFRACESHELQEDKLYTIAHDLLRWQRLGGFNANPLPTRQTNSVRIRRNIVSFKMAVRRRAPNNLHQTLELFPANGEAKKTCLHRAAEANPRSTTRIQNHGVAHKGEPRL